MDFKGFQIFKKSNRFNATTYKFGLKEENRLLQPLQEFFKDPSLEPLPEGSKFDFQGDGTIVELKSRTCRHNQYETTCIGVCKIRYAKLHCHESDFYFVFNYTDGLYYWKYDPDQPLIEGEIYGIPHYFIPMNLLSPIINNDTAIFTKGV